jgi:hypothetical protein
VVEYRKVFRRVGFFVACSGDLARMNPGASQCAAGQPGGKRTIFRLSPPNLVEASPLARNVARIKMLSI